jgi:uncharacterized membrane protein YcjF (UPF0283 family)
MVTSAPSNRRLLAQVGIIYFSTVVFIGLPLMYTIMSLLTDLFRFSGIEWIMYTAFGFVFVIISLLIGVKISEYISKNIIEYFGVVEE